MIKKTRNTTFAINGGAGRVITAIPALEKYHIFNPQDDFKVIIAGWESLYWNHPLLQQKTFSILQKGMFDLVIKNNDFICPEPYARWSYYNQKTSLAEAFDEEINQTEDHCDLKKPNLYLHSTEIAMAIKMIEEAKQIKNKKKFIVFQPYGSGIKMIDKRPGDPSNRSLDVDDALNLAKLMSQDAAILYFGPNEFIHPGDDFMLNAKNVPNPDLRFYMTMIANCDLFIGCDSLGQHIARAFDKKGVIVMGSTFEKNVSYPDYFKFYRNKNVPITYNPIRIGGPDCEFADRLNDGCMKFTKQQIEEIYELTKS